jgi:6-phosphogluconolactonase
VSAEPEVVRLADGDALAADVAARTLAVLGAALAERPVAHLIVTGGSILEKVLAALDDPDAVDWSRVHVWWGDERFVAADSEDRNDLPAIAKLFGSVPAVLHPMPPSGGEFGDDAEAAAVAYGAELAGFAESGADVPAFDVALIGLGPDGHCCSLFPNHPGTRVLDRSVTAVHDSPKPPPTRLSLTFPTLDATREMWFIASGDGKADAVERALGGAPREEVPSAGPRGTEHTLWLVDEAAASQLP